VHSINASICAVDAVKIRVAVGLPELDVATVNDVEPHPAILGEDKDENLKFGRTREIVSPTESRELRTKEYEKEVLLEVVTGLKEIKLEIKFETGAIVSME